MSVYDDYEMTIGIECHVQLATKTKLFSPADNDARDAEPNTKTHQIDFGLPGMLPVLNKRAVELAVRAGKALNSPIAHVSRFDRKHYFYPDLPKGYQTSQMYNPIILAGYVDAPLEDGSLKRVRIDHAHMEEDAGKLTHHDGYSLVDLNRAGTPLIEIVSEPDMHSAEEAKAYVSELHKLMVYAGVTYGNLYHGNMRFDVNISVAKKGAAELGKRAEIKNLNSFRSVERAAEYEFKRQVDILERGEEVVQETRGWNDDKQITISQRSKEDAQDYRYMPDPDIPPVVLTDEVIAEIQSKVPMLPGEYREKWSVLNLDKSVINSLLSNQDYAQITLEVQEKSGEASAKRVAHWFASALTASDESDAQTDNESTRVAVDDLIELAEMTEKSEVSSTNAKELFNELLVGAKNPRKLAEEKNLLQVSDESAIAAIVDEVLSDPASAASIADIKAGKDKAIGYLVGQVMKKSKGQANPSLAQKLIRERL
ncbi:Asp-tRNA(Asn)/Glu-tRNA(Gln) amidotransferase subunit GatB [Candidatus Nanosynbacter sp. HMT-352]|uniref:Asp-tRNA(Asn)/Glu-tRNA(Gln) amidotransferase subunit GatB n=1 Tax=Candidatus Nanosynbacter sp. HMT-352 TaxID=2899133 RepID=UPI001FB7A83A|nr:Asp-tRNA(Asn)/Glu-tRNA(Gln) amidotransferase subunit GatB [Candidatus Nanosynbacter sp. HMT-352]UOG67430.1 Asp-tRNA(Asn)/Glu-tRNA(Gln) amidotransferase subunit GatB [Candidatus Nanosynbacter sp. HMT-352]